MAYAYAKIGDKKFAVEYDPKNKRSRRTAQEIVRLWLREQETKQGR